MKFVVTKCNSCHCDVPRYTSPDDMDLCPNCGEAVDD